MSNDEAEALMETFERWDSRNAKRQFINKMEHKLRRKEKFGFR